MAALTLFDVLKDITRKRTPWEQTDEEFKKAYSQFMINRFASSCELYIQPLAEISKYAISDKTHHAYVTSFFHIGGPSFNYNSYKKSKDEFEYAVPFICRYFEIGKREANQYLELLNKEQIESICALYETR